MKCPVCQADSPGAYCPACGAPVDGARCGSCESPLLPGANFCVKCGKAVRAGGSAALPWYIAGAAVAALLIVLLFPGLRGGGSPATGVSGPPAMGADASSVPGSRRPPPLTGTPREQADQLFNRVMQAIALNDEAQASFFLPMAILAYQQAGDLDADGLYHLSVLETASGNAAAGRATAERVLEESPDHILALGAAARAADAVGDAEAARRHYEHLLRVFDGEVGRDRPEYIDHSQILPEYRAEAESYLAR